MKFHVQAFFHRAMPLFGCIALFGALTGCAGFSQIVAAKAQSERIAIEAANDNIVIGIKDAICLLPYGTLLRHPEMQPAVISICGPSHGAGQLLTAAKETK